MDNTLERSSLSSAEIRLECLRLAHRHDRSPEETIRDARMYLAWVGGTIPPTTGESLPGDRAKEPKPSPVSKRTSSPNT